MKSGEGAEQCAADQYPVEVADDKVAIGRAENRTEQLPA